MRKTQIALALATGLAVTQPAYALGGTAWFDMSNPQITYTDLNSSDAVTPLLTFRETDYTSGPQISASVWETVGYSTIVDGGSNTTSWPGNVSFSYTTSTPPGAVGAASWSDGIAYATLDGHVDGGRMFSAAWFWSGFSLTPYSTVEFRIPARVTVDATGSDDQHQAYADVFGYFQMLDNSTVWDQLRLTHWDGTGTLERDFVLTLTNSGADELIGSFSVGAVLNTVWIRGGGGPGPTVPEPASLALLGLGLAGLAAMRRRKSL